MDKLSRFLQGTIFLFAGVVIAVIVSEFFETLTASLESGLLLIISSIMILSAIFIARIGTNTTEVVRESLQEVNHIVTETVNALGVRVRYVEDRWIDGGSREGRVFETVQSIVANAEEEILISGYNDPKFDPTLISLNNLSIEDASQERRIAYLETIEQKLEQDRQPPFRYYRILQMPDADSVILSTVTLGPVEFNHCRSVLYIKKKTHNKAINIMKIFTERISTFVIVDNKFLILSDLGTRRTEKGEGEYLAGIFIIEDLTGNVINGFKDYFWSQLVPSASVVELKDLYGQDKSESL